MTRTGFMRDGLWFCFSCPPSCRSLFLHSCWNHIAFKLQSRDPHDEIRFASCSATGLDNEIQGPCIAIGSIYIIRIRTEPILGLLEHLKSYIPHTFEHLNGRVVETTVDDRNPAWLYNIPKP